MDDIKVKFLDWLASLDGFDEANEEVHLMMEAAFTQGYMSCLRQSTPSVTLSAEEKEALSGWTDLEEIR